MKAAVYSGDGEFQVTSCPDPVTGPRDVLIRPDAVGVCGTDAHIIHGNFMSRPPVILGHEVAGTVVEVGHQVTSVEVGDLVTVEPHIYCETCFNCRTGSKHMCPERRAPGVHLNGGMAELLAVPETIAFPLPAGTNVMHGAMTEPVACCIHGMDRLGHRSGLPALVFGCGPAGAIMISLLRMAGASQVIAVDSRPHRRELALRVGATAVLDPADPSFVSDALAFTGGVGYPSIIDAVGSAAVVEQAISLSTRGGNVLLFGVANPSARASISPNEVYAKEISILGTALNPDTHQRAIGMLPLLPLDEFAFGVFPLEKAQDAIEAQQLGEFDKVIITLQGGSSEEKR